MGDLIAVCGNPVPSFAGRKLKADIAAYDAALARYGGNLAALQVLRLAFFGLQIGFQSDLSCCVVSKLARQHGPATAAFCCCFQRRLCLMMWHMFLPDAAS